MAMPVLRRFALAVGVSISVIAGFGDGAPASAQSLEITDEATGEHCARVGLQVDGVKGGCLLHVKSERSLTILKMVFGIEAVVTDCAAESHIRVDEDGEGYFVNQQLTGPDCTRQPCREGDGFEVWPVDMEMGRPDDGPEESPAATNSRLRTMLCFFSELDRPRTEEHCAIDLGFKFDEPSHSYELGHSGALRIQGIASASDFACEFVGHLLIEAGGSHEGEREQDVAMARSNYIGRPID
jgi:hypothetical protein